jgi:hypothetical protein
MSARDYINVQKALPGEYSYRNESFTLAKTSDDDNLSLTASTDFEFFKMKKGDSIPIKKVDIEEHLNKQLFNFKRKL